MPRPVVFTFPAIDADGLAVLQVIASGVSIKFNGVLGDAAATMQQVNRAIMGPGIQRTVTLHSTADLHLINFTIVGVDVNGTAVTEVLVGPNNTTVISVNEYAIVTSITPDGAVLSNIEAGSGSVGHTRWITVDRHQNPCNISIAIDITATAQFTVQDTPADINAGTAPTSTSIFNHPVLAAITASAESNYAWPPRFIRGSLDSSSGSGAATMTLIQAGV